jgi:hypothetical protein
MLGAHHHPAAGVLSATASGTLIHWQWLINRTQLIDRAFVVDHMTASASPRALCVIFQGSPGLG